MNSYGHQPMQMALANRLLSTNEDHAKKNDDPQASNFTSSTLLSKAWRGRRRKRVILVLIGLWLLYILLTNIPTDLSPVPRRILSPQDLTPSNAPPTPELQFDLNEPIKFYNLGASLRKVSYHDSTYNPNVLFAFSSLRSASRIIPMACAMSRQKRNQVHIAFMGRDDTPIEVIKQVNGIIDEDCSVHWHDARPDYPSISSEKRMKMSVRASLTHLYSLARTHVAVTDTSLENAFFTSAMSEKTMELGMALIAMPKGGTESLQWMTKLDAASLWYWDKLRLEIIVHGNAESSASLMRLLRSLQNADYFGYPRPRLTVELPSNVDPPTLAYLAKFRWPPLSSDADSKLTIRHRTNPKLFTPTEASLHTVEAFYPTDPTTSHVLILTPDAELSPSYYHYLMYAILEYKYSVTSKGAAQNLMGISLELPSKGLNGSKSFDLSEFEIGTPCFLWQAPNSNAGVYFGDRWAEFHSFLSKRLTVQLQLELIGRDDKLVSTHLPAWMEYMLEFMRAKGYSMLYPAFARQTGSALVTIHKELFKDPEEFLTKERAASKLSQVENAAKSPDKGNVLTADLETNTPEKDAGLTRIKSVLSLLSSTPILGVDSHDQSGFLRQDQLPILSYLGESLTTSDSQQLSTAFADEFSLAHGGCKSLQERSKLQQWPADFLFCLPDLIPTDPVAAAG